MTTKTGREYMAMRSAVAIHLEAGLTNSWLFPLNKWGPYFRPVVTITFERLRLLDEGERDWPKNSPNLASFRRILNLRPRDRADKPRTYNSQISVELRCHLVSKNRCKLP